MAMDSKQTVYKGICFRSKLEAQFAVFLDRLNDKVEREIPFSWAYEPYTYDMGGFRYTPDFVIRCRDGEWNDTDRLPQSWDSPGEIFDDGRDIIVFEVKPHFNIDRAKDIIRWKDKICPGNGDSQILNAWQLASNGANLWYVVSDAFRDGLSLIRGFDYQRAECLEDVHFDFDAEMPDHVFDRAMRAARLFRFGNEPIGSCCLKERSKWQAN